MKSKAHIKSHPIHPILVGFPIAFFVGAFLCDVVVLVTENKDLHIVARYLIPPGIIAGLIAAVPGIIDYINVVPPESSAKRRGAKHGLLNTFVILIFTAVFLLRDDQSVSPIVLPGLEFAGLILLSISGWLGGTLVYRNQIGVDIRYAESGKWRELVTDTASGRIEVARKDELQTNQMKLLRLQEKRIVLARTEDGFVAFDDHCTHKGASLAGGAMICGTVQCPWHGSQFDVRTGAVKAGPGKQSIPVYKVETDGEGVFIIL